MSEPTVKEYYYADADAKPVGPQTAEKLRELRHRGVLTDETLVIEVAGTEWVAYRTLGNAVTLPPVPVPKPGGFLLLKRTATALALFALLSFALYVGAVAVGGAVVAAMNGASHPTGDVAAAYQQGKEAGTAFAAEYGTRILAGSVVVGFLAALALSFSNVLPWCRRPKADRLATR